MVRLILIFSLFLLVFSVTLIMPVSGDNNTSSACLVCHEQLYSKAVSTPYRHTVATKGCVICHNIKNIPKYEGVITSPYYQESIILGLAALLDKGEKYDKEKKYKIEIKASDLSGNRAKPIVIDVSTQKIWNRPEKTFDITKISNLKIKSIKRGMFTKAMVSWNTNVPATSEVEYGSFTNHKRIFPSRKVFSRIHKIDLTGLNNNGEYILRVTSKDLNGNTIQSDNLVFNTFKGFNFTSYPEMQKPEVAIPMLFNIGNNDDLFIRVSANTPVKFKIKMQEIQDKATRPCVGFTQTRYSTIKVCLQCHQQDASHPVGVRSNRPNIEVSDELPTIEDGIMTCVTCHYPHGGNKEYFLRVDFGKEICAKCHSSYYNYIFER